jgi:TPR repeat protein
MAPRTFLLLSLGLVVLSLAGCNRPADSIDISHARSAADSVSNRRAAVPTDPAVLIAQARVDLVKPGRALDAVKTLEPLAKSGNAKAQLALAEGYLTGIGVPRDYKSALQLLEMAASQGEADALAHIAGLYYSGHGVAVDLKRGDELLSQAIQANSLRAKFMRVSRIIQQSDSSESARIEAFAVLREARSTVPESYLVEAYFLSEGIGGPKRPTDAIKVFQLGVDHGCVGCLVDLAYAYLSGEGVLKDFERASMLLQQASDEGDGRARYSLGKVYYDGTGVAKDLVRAYAWLNLASASDSGSMRDPAKVDAAKIRDSIEKDPTFSSRQLREAQKLSANWQPGSIPIVFPEESAFIDPIAVDAKQRIGTGTGFLSLEAGIF